MCRGVGDFMPAGGIPQPVTTQIPMKILLIFIPLVILTACEKKTAPERAVDKIENKVKDATDSRPGEKIRDAVEDAQDAVKK
jgi:hypothetical protein